MKHENKVGLFRQTYQLLLLSIIIVGAVTAVSQYFISENRISMHMNSVAESSIAEVIFSVKEYPAYRWLLSYWANHADEMEVEYEADFSNASITYGKIRRLHEKEPDFDLRYCSEAEVEELPDSDQKLYAEIVYAWMINRMNGIKENFGCDYLYCVLTDTDTGENPYETVTYLLSGAASDSVRGTEYGNAYTLGHAVSVLQNEGQQKAMRRAVELRQKTVAEKGKQAGNYEDYYACLEILGDKAVLAGTAYSLKTMKDEILRSALLYFLNTTLLQFSLMNVFMWYFSGYLLRPLAKILGSIRSYTETKDGNKAEKELRKLLADRHGIAIRKNEIGQLAKDVIDLAREIDDYTIQLAESVARQQRIEFELETAADIQKQMLPQGAMMIPGHPDCELSASMIPAREVGGDFYDYFLLDNDHLAVVMADVSDKGVPAALFMAQARTLIRSRAQAGEEPEQILNHVNNQLTENNEKGYFVTVWLAVIDLGTGEGTAVNAGHEHPALCRKGKDFELVIYKHSPAVGMMRGIRYKQHPFRLEPGDMLFIYTDGVPEAVNPGLEQFGTDRMLQLLTNCKESSPDELLAALNKAIDGFAGEAGRFDDTTMMCLRYK